ncbi:hypothetical protein G5714_004609 [Onychostoma macrolepis]|uniref:Uncharacterized protein n=1 Tax=Onychostoma macrolepis TaxID=369639 RepID=A0A7J6D569_9TELE|nr:hypothetical protein G5714_004609 [Onychostoma macrolepis]
MAISALDNRYVLLEWTEGEDRGAHSILALNCVRNFSVKDFLERTDKTEKLVEWRKGRKPWPVHRARIIDVANSREETEPFKESPMVTERFRETPQAEAWRAAHLATSATAMVRNLLLGTFDLETLLKSNLNGGKPTRGDGEQLVALDQIKKAAIIGE